MTVGTTVTVVTLDRNKNAKKDSVRVCIGNTDVFGLSGTLVERRRFSDPLSN